MESEKNLQEKENIISNNNKGAKTSSEVAKRRRILKKLRCFGSTDNNNGYPTTTTVDGNGNVDMHKSSVARKQKLHSPTHTHLVVMVNGLIGSAHNWRYSAKQLLNSYPDDLIVHCSKHNSSLLTFNGVDVVGNRLANEVISVIKRHPKLEKISFIGHSLGGLVARYAIAKLYTQDSRIAGLVAINFITIATPHLGTGAHRQVPMFGGSNTVEKVAHQISWVLGRTVPHCSPSSDMLSMQMLILTRKNLVRSGKYPHILKGGTTNTILKRESCMELLQANNYKAATASMEEAMMRGLTKISWERIDVSFKGSKQRYFAHNTIQVNTPWMNSDGADIIQHLVDNFQL